MRKAIICFLEKDDKLLLLHTDYKSKLVWNGVSGYIDDGENETDAVIREIREEIGVETKQEDLIRKGSHDIFTIFLLKQWFGIPESKEASILELKWFKKDSLPYSQMHEGNEEWLPELLK